MAFEFNLSLTSTVSLHISGAHQGFFGVFWEKRERGFALERQWFGRSGSGKWLETWRNPYCATLNVSIPGTLLMIYGGNRSAVPAAV